MNARPLTVQERAGRYLDTLPAAVSGQAGHDATFRAAAVLVHGFALPEDAALGLLLSHFNGRCAPPWSVGELTHKVRSAAGAPSEKGRGYLLDNGEPVPPLAPAVAPRPKWPASDPARIAAALRGGPTALELWKRSPVLLDADDGSNAAEIVRGLFPGDPLVCIGASNAVFATRRLSRFLADGRLSDWQFIVPSPMSSVTGKTKGGRTSEHTLANTGPRAFVVVEFDTGTADEHAARLWHFPPRGPGDRAFQFTGRPRRALTDVSALFHRGAGSGRRQPVAKPATSPTT